MKEKRAKARDAELDQKDEKATFTRSLQKVPTHTLLFAFRLHMSKKRAKMNKRMDELMHPVLEQGQQQKSDPHLLAVYKESRRVLHLPLASLGIQSRKGLQSRRYGRRATGLQCLLWQRRQHRLKTC